MSNKFNLTDESNFHYLLELLLPLHDEPEYAWLPELFSTIGADGLIKLSKYAGGETIKVPTIAELSSAISALEWYYKVFIAQEAKITDIPVELHKEVYKIAERIDNARNN